MKFKKIFLSLFLSLSVILSSITVFASSDMVSNEVITIGDSEVQYLPQETVDRLYATGELDENLLDKLIAKGVFGSIQRQPEPSPRWGVGKLGLSADGNYVEVKCMGFDSGTVAVEGEVLIMNKAGGYTIMPFYISCSGIYNQSRYFYYCDWSYAKITSAVAYGPNGKYTVVSLPSPIKR